MSKDHDKKNTMLGFCHNHEDLEKKLGLKEEHVVVDRKDWEEVQKLRLNFVCCFCFLPISKEMNFLSDFGKTLKPSESNWICNDCKSKIITGL